MFQTVIHTTLRLSRSIRSALILPFATSQTDPYSSRPKHPRVDEDAIISRGNLSIVSNVIRGYSRQQAPKRKKKWSERHSDVGLERFWNNPANGRSRPAAVKFYDFAVHVHEATSWICKAIAVCHVTALATPSRPVPTTSAIRSPPRVQPPSKPSRIIRSRRTGSKLYRPE